jgi:tRNA (cmo5U34)-methyltransferase
MRIYGVLSNGGVFLNSDSVLGSNESLNEIYMKKWVEFMLQNVPREEVEEKWLPKHADEDFPAPLIQHLQWLNEIGFKNIDIIWKYYGSAVYCGSRP